MAFLCNGMFVPPPVYAKCLSKSLARMHARVAAEKLLVNAPPTTDSFLIIMTAFPGLQGGS